MKIVFLSNFYNHHQSFISEKLYELTSGNYRFIATTPVPKERKKLGYSDEAPHYVVQYDPVADQDLKVQNLIDSADIVIVGSAPENLLKNRKRQKKLIFRYSERPLKNGFQWWKYPARFVRWHWNNPGNVPIYMLCASAYTALDYRCFGLFRNRALKWGYFPECRKYPDVCHMMSQKDFKEILWCGRFIDWKHPDAALSIAERLKNDGYAFRLTFIGTGEMEQTLKDIARDRGLLDVVAFLGSKRPDEVRLRMERAGMFLFTSDRKEGWGAVLNEAMNSGCAVIASCDAGSTPYLVTDNKNGLIYHSGDLDALYEKTKFLLSHPQEQQRLGYAAYNTIVQLWNPDIAAERLVDVFGRVLNGQIDINCFDEGPCSAV